MTKDEKQSLVNEIRRLSQPSNQSSGLVGKFESEIRRLTSPSTSNQVSGLVAKFESE
ncbi:MAG: hypothetical protein WCP79_14620 [Bacillota bacterium]